MMDSTKFVCFAPLTSQMLAGQGRCIQLLSAETSIWMDYGWFLTFRSPRIADLIWYADAPILHQPSRASESLSSAVGTLAHNSATGTSPAAPTVWQCNQGLDNKNRPLGQQAAPFPRSGLWGA